jgi:hypothetical protein
MFDPVHTVRRLTVLAGAAIASLALAASASAVPVMPEGDPVPPPAPPATPASGGFDWVGAIQLVVLGLVIVAAVLAAVYLVRRPRDTVAAR